MAKPAHRKLIGNHKLIFGILVTAFRDQFPFGDLNATVRQHLEPIGQVHVSDDLVRELVRREFVSEAQSVAIGPNLSMNPPEGATHVLDPVKGMRMILGDPSYTDRVLSRSVVRWLAILNNGGELPAGFEEDIDRFEAEVIDGRDKGFESIHRFREGLDQHADGMRFA